MKTVDVAILDLAHSLYCDRHAEPDWTAIHRLGQELQTVADEFFERGLRNARQADMLEGVGCG